MKIHKRLDALEKVFSLEPTILRMEDGRTETIIGPKDHMFHLFLNCSTPEKLTTRQATDLERVKHSVKARERGGGRISELIRCFHAGPVKKTNSQQPGPKIPGEAIDATAAALGSAEKE